MMRAAAGTRIDAPARAGGRRMAVPFLVLAPFILPWLAAGFGVALAHVAAGRRGTLDLTLAEYRNPRVAKNFTAIAQLNQAGRQLVQNSGTASDQPQTGKTEHGN